MDPKHTDSSFPMPAVCVGRVCQVHRGHTTHRASFTVGGRGVNQHAGHGFTVDRITGVDSLGDRCACVAALDGKLANERMRKGMEQDVPNTRIAFIRVEMFTDSP